MAHRPDHRDRRRRLPRQRRLVRRARQALGGGLGAHARENQGAERKRPRRPERMSLQKTPPRPAATLLLLRDSQSTTEVFMLQRTSKAAFLPGAFVFPGGALDPDDASERAARRVRGLDDAQASARMGLASGGLAYWIAAARECFEESGILLVFDSKDLPIDPRRAEDLEPL